MLRLPIALTALLMTMSVQAAELLNVNAAGTDSGDDFSSIPSEELLPFSTDGNLVVFNSAATNLGPVDTNGSTDIYLRDRSNGTTELISVNSAGTDSGDNFSSRASLSEDGRYVVFISFASDLDAGVTDTNGVEDIFIRDRNSGTTTLISRNAGGTTSGNSFSQNYAMTPDAAYIVFESDASDLVANDTNTAIDVFLYSRASNSFTLVSKVAGGGVPANGESDIFNLSSISDDGRYVVFASTAPDIVAGDVGGFEDIFLYDANSGINTRLSTNNGGVSGANGDSGEAYISANGSTIILRSQATDLVVATDTNTVTDYFALARVSGVKKLISVNAAGSAAASGGGNTAGGRISADGRFFAWESTMTDLVTTDTNGFQDVFVRDLVNNVTSLVSLNRDGADSCNAGSDDVQLSRNGRLVFYESNCTDITADTDVNGSKDSFVFDRETGINYLLSESVAGGSTGNNFCYDPMPSLSGNAVQMDCGATDIDPNVMDSNMATDAYVTDVAALIPAAFQDSGISGGGGDSGGGGGSSLSPALLGLLLVGLVARRLRRATLN